MSEQEQIHFETALDDAGNRTMKVTIDDASGSHTANVSTWSELAQCLNVQVEMKQPSEQESIWLMDSECCDKCGAALNYFESVLCTDCLQDAWYDEEQERYALWDDEG